MKIVILINYQNFNKGQVIFKKLMNQDVFHVVFKAIVCMCLCACVCFHTCMYVCSVRTFRYG